MDISDFQADLSLGETPSIEFKRCGNAPGADAFETICSFANSYGGSIYLGVEDDGCVIGVSKTNIAAVKRNIANVVHNPNVFDPPAVFEFEDIDFEGASVIRIWVPPSPSMHQYKGKIYERIADADIAIQTETQLTALCIRKQSIYTEQRVFPYVTKDDLQLDLLPTVRTMAAGKRGNHPWLKMSDSELLRSAGLQGKNFATNEEGFNLAAVLLLGNNDVIRSLCPAYKTDAILRKDNIDRYDDRILVTSNLVEAYDVLIEFCTKHLPNQFYLEGTEAVSPRDIIARELVSNCIVHREYTSPFPAKLILEADALRTENASRAPFQGRITLDDFNPIPKNPLIASFFNHIGRAEELGSGTRNLFKYVRAYSGGVPLLEEGIVFKATIPLRKETNAAPDHHRTPGVHDAVVDIAHEYGFVTVSDLEARGIARRTAQRELALLVENGTLRPEGKARARRYVLTSE